MNTDPDLFVVHLLQLLGQNLGHRVLDAGSGTGRNAAYLQSAGREVICYDVARSALIRSRDESGVTNTLHGRIEALPFTDSSFDAAICTSVLESVTDQAACAAVEELRRVVRPGGHLLIVAASAEGSDEDYSTTMPGAAHQARLTTREQLDSWFGSLDWLELLHLQLVVPNTASVRSQWSLIARKPARR